MTLHGHGRACSRRTYQMKEEDLRRLAAFLSFLSFSFLSLLPSLFLSFLLSALLLFLVWTTTANGPASDLPTRCNYCITCSSALSERQARLSGGQPAKAAEAHAQVRHIPPSSQQQHQYVRACGAAGA